MLHFIRKAPSNKKTIIQAFIIIYNDQNHNYDDEDDDIDTGTEKKNN